MKDINKKENPYRCDKCYIGDLHKARQFNCEDSKCGCPCRHSPAEVRKECGCSCGFCKKNNHCYRSMCNPIEPAELNLASRSIEEGGWEERFRKTWQMWRENQGKYQKIKFFIEKEISLARTEEKNYWMYQKGNDHDNKIREVALADYKAELVEQIEKLPTFQGKGFGDLIIKADILSLISPNKE